jgi:hypothetical protein
MAMISISSPVFDVDGNMLSHRLDTTANLFTQSRRVSRTATLDGSAIIEDLGYSVADRTLTLAVRGLSRSDADNLERMVQGNTRLVVSSDAGIFSCAISNYNYSDGVATLTALVGSDLAA